MSKIIKIISSMDTKLMDLRKFNCLESTSVKQIK